MKKLFLISAVLLTACGGSLTDEQRKKLREGSEQQTIVKVTEAEITEAAFAKGRSVISLLKNNNPDTSKVAAAEAVEIHWLAAGKTHGLEIEQQLIDAYLEGIIRGESLQDNVQKIGKDSLLYTSPLVITRADSSIEVKGTWNVWMAKRELILAMNKR